MHGEYRECWSSRRCAVDLDSQQRRVSFCRLFILFIDHGQRRLPTIDLVFALGCVESWTYLSTIQVFIRATECGHSPSSSSSVRHSGPSPAPLWHQSASGGVCRPSPASCPGTTVVIDLFAGMPSSNHSSEWHRYNSPQTLPALAIALEISGEFTTYSYSIDRQSLDAFQLAS